MVIDILHDSHFVSMMRQHIEAMLIYLFDKEQNFGILCHIEHLTFEPSLPEHISNEFRPVTLFYLAGYTFDSARIDGDNLIFEAGFGQENIGSFVTVPLYSIMQIIIDETPILINHAIYKNAQQREETPQESGGIETSMAAFLSNPENQKFIKNR